MRAAQAAIGGAAEFRLLMGTSEQVRTAYEKSGQLASEAVGNIRTVVALSLPHRFIADYNDNLQAPLKVARKQSVGGGIAYGFSQAVIFFIFSISFAYGGQLVEWGLNDFVQIMTAMSAILFAGMNIGQSSQLAPDANKARTAAAAIFTLLDRVPPIDSSSPDGRKLTDVDGRVEFKDVKFAYPNRPDVQVLRGLNFSLEPGKTLALVGASGCGKSTVIQLLERFYNPSAGQILLDGVDVRELNLHWLREQIGLVGQEPVLFATSILENIRYGKPDATMAEVEAAAKAANAASFINELPDGYNTQVGERGTQLSGGQKQRIAIARALVRNPKVLLLDEATSALDSESEKIVQAALDHAREGRTTIVIAHRLSTITTSDCIAVIDAGVVVESGTHAELMDLKGRYYELVRAQALNVH